MVASAEGPEVPELKLRVITHKGAKVVVCSGWLTRDFAGVFKKEIKKLLPGAKYLVLDLEGITYMDSSGIGAVASVYVTARTSGGSLRVANMSQHVRRLLGITRLLSILTQNNPYPIAT